MELPTEMLDSHPLLSHTVLHAAAVQINQTSVSCKRLQVLS
jgi:hypothetical protein